MTDAKANTTRSRAQRRPSSQRDPNHPLPMWPTGYIYAEQGKILASANGKTTAGDGQERDDAVGQLAGALRSAKRAHRTYLTELRQGDVEPAEDWSTWYAEYLLGLR
jgi:hypothetical protein